MTTNDFAPDPNLSPRDQAWARRLHLLVGTDLYVMLWKSNGNVTTDALIANVSNDGMIRYSHPPKQTVDQESKPVTEVRWVEMHVADVVAISHCTYTRKQDG